MKESKYCEHCKAKMVEYKHGFSKPLATGLWRLYKAGGTVNLKDLNLTRNQWDNFQKLRYWDLVAPAYRETGLRMSGCWYITPVGIEAKQFASLGTLAFLTTCTTWSMNW